MCEGADHLEVLEMYERETLLEDALALAESRQEPFRALLRQAAEIADRLPSVDPFVAATRSSVKNLWGGEPVSNYPEVLTRRQAFRVVDAPTIWLLRNRHPAIMMLNRHANALRSPDERRLAEKLAASASEVFDACGGNSLLSIDFASRVRTHLAAAELSWQGAAYGIGLVPTGRADRHSSPAGLHA